MRNFVLLILAGGSISLGASADVALNVMRDANRLVDCTKSIDAKCVIALSHQETYAQLSTPPFSFAELQTRFFNYLRKWESKFTRFKVSTPSKISRGKGLMYVFVPYESTLQMQGQLSEISAYLIGFSDDDGTSWKFFDAGECTSAQDIKRIIPSYAYDPLPPTNNLAKLDRSAPDRCFKPTR